MSGGHFNYSQAHISSIADEIEDMIHNNDSTKMDEWGYKRGRQYSHETIEQFKKAVSLLREAREYVQRVDWLVSGDDGEETFHQRLAEDLKRLGDM